MQLLTLPAGRDLDSCYEADAEVGTGLRSLRTATHGIVIGEGGKSDALSGNQLHERCRREYAV